MWTCYNLSDSLSATQILFYFWYSHAIAVCSRATEALMFAFLNLGSNFCILAFRACFAVEIHFMSNLGHQIYDMYHLAVLLWILPLSLVTAWVWICASQNILSTQAFWQALLWPWIILCSPLPPSRHNHTCLILSNLSFILANQLLCCALFHHLLSCDSIIISLTPIPNSVLLSCTSSVSPSWSAFPCHCIRVNLDPSKRQGSNKSVSGCTLPQGSKTVSKFPCLSLLFYMPVLPHLSAWSRGNLLQTMNACLTFSYLYLWITACLHDLVIIITLSSYHALGFKHGCNQIRFIWFLFLAFSFRISVIVSRDWL